MAMLFITSLLTPRIDVAAFLWQKFQQGPSSVGYIKAVESVTVILVPLTPAIPLLTRRLGYSGASVACAMLMALCWLGITNVRSMKELYVMVFLRSAISTIYEPSIKSILMNSAKARKKEQIGSFSGIQQSMKGMSQVMGSFWGSFLAGYSSADVPVSLSALVNLANAAIIHTYGVVEAPSVAQQSLGRPPRVSAQGADAAAGPDRGSRENSQAKKDR